MATRPILIAVDFGETAAAVVAAGLGLASRLEAQALLVHVDAYAVVLPEALRAEAAMRVGEMKADYHRKALQALTALTVETGHDPAAVALGVLDGRPHQAIVAEAAAQRARLVVVGSRSQPRGDRMSLGRTAAQIARGARCAVFTVDVDRPWRAVRHVLYASALEPGAPQPAERWAVRLAGVFGARLTVAHVMDVSTPLAEPYAMSPVQAQARVERVRERLAEERLRVEALAARVRPGAAAVEAQLLDDPDPAHRLRRFAVERDVDVVVTGTHGRTGLRRLLLGSVAETILRQSPTNVLVARR